MFGKKKQKQETLVRMRNLAQLDEGFFAHMKDGKDMFDATAREIRNTYQQLGAGITQIQENIKEASQMAADNGEKEQELTGQLASYQEQEVQSSEKREQMLQNFAQIEQEIAELDDDEKAMFLEDLGLKESGLEKLIRASYSLLGLMSFLTAGEDETRAWTIKIGTKAPQAAGKIHTDFERGFIKAEVVNYKDLLEQGSLAAAREKGLVGMEGKDYVVKDGDVILFRFNV